MDLRLMGRRGVIEMDDFVLDWGGGFLMPEGGATAGYVLKEGLCPPSGWVRGRVSFGQRQSVAMLDAFAGLCAEPEGVGVSGSMGRSLRTQGMVDALMAGLEVEGGCP